MRGNWFLGGLIGCATLLTACAGCYAIMTLVLTTDSDSSARVAIDATVQMTPTQTVVPRPNTPQPSDVPSTEPTPEAPSGEPTPTPAASRQTRRRQA
ncbi:MAG: hypothetical protein ACLFTK_11175, partial [Anaerolineales bacterium]